MEWYRIANLVMQAAYLPAHFILILQLIRKRQPTPIWRWFIVVVVGLWVMISGRLFETLAYLFLPVNGFYVFAVYYQLVGTSFATSAYLIWNLYLAGHDRLSENRIFKTVMLALSGTVSLIICTNSFHHLFYEKLVMGEQVVHGKLFLPCLLIVYGTLFAGWLVSVVHIIRKEKEKIRRLVVFSLYPILPAAAALIRSITGVDTLDYMPIIMTVSIICLYLMVFRYRYVDIVSQSVENALENTRSALLVYDIAKGETVYKNKACELYTEAIPEIIQGLTGKTEAVEQFGEKTLHISGSVLAETELVLITVNDISEIANERRMIENDIAEQSRMVAELEDKKRNIDAYLSTLYEIPHLREKQEMIVSAQEEINSAFRTIESDLCNAKDVDSDAETALLDGIRTAQTTMASVRTTVAALREEI
ncbi:MAG: hypothetical protein J6112_06620 [Clostridia bacterium]|nr:hypothetical protein [Clostridia bacterium]